MIAHFAEDVNIFFHFFSCRKSLGHKELRPGAAAPPKLSSKKMDARDGIEPSITLLQRVVLPFDHPALLAENVFAVYRNNVLLVNRLTSLDTYKTFILVRIVGDAF